MEGKTAKEKLLDQVRYVIRVKHFSVRAEQAYVNWIIEGDARAEIA